MTNPLNPDSRWNSVPIFGAFFKGDGTTPVQGKVRLTFTQRVTRVDRRAVYPEGHMVERTIGDSEADPVTRDAVRAAWRAADEAAAAAAGQTFDGAAWDAWWNTWLTGAVFASFPAADDPDIVHDPDNPYQVKVEEQLVGGMGKVYYITPLLAQLQQTPPGINLSAVEVPPGAPNAPAPVYLKGAPGGVAALDADGDVTNADGLKVGLPGLAAVIITADPAHPRPDDGRPVLWYCPTTPTNWQDGDVHHVITPATEV